MTKSKEVAKPMSNVDYIREQFGLTKTQAEDISMAATEFDFEKLREQAEIAVIPGATNKDTLVGVPFVIVGWDAEAYSENFSASYCKVLAMTEDNKPVMFADFGSGIRQVLKDFEAKRGIKPIFCAQGLRKSIYGPHYSEAAERDVPGGETFYLT